MRTFTIDINSTNNMAYCDLIEVTKSSINNYFEFNFDMSMTGKRVKITIRKPNNKYSIYDIPSISKWELPTEVLSIVGQHSCILDIYYGDIRRTIKPFQYWVKADQEGSPYLSELTELVERVEQLKTEGVQNFRANAMTLNTSSSTTNCWYDGIGLPVSSFGLDGDYYLKLPQGDIYNKVLGAWERIGNIMGPQGNTGTIGPKGEQGERGLRGEAGPIGPIGPSGQKGDKGDVGAGVTIKGDLAGFHELPYNPQIGDGYTILGDFYIWDGKNWNNIGSIVGPRGPQGLIGPKGDKGDIGIAGPIGPKGDVGPEGPRGLLGPRGEKGEKGEKGVAGNTTYWYDGTGIPNISLGKEKDYYLDIKTADIYRKEISHWERIGNIKPAIAEDMEEQIKALSSKVDDFYPHYNVVLKNIRVDGDSDLAYNGKKLTGTKYVHKQISSSDTWSIKHNLNALPSVTIVDSGDSVVFGDVQYIDMNNIKISFSNGFAGKAYLN